MLVQQGHHLLFYFVCRHGLEFRHVSVMFAHSLKIGDDLLQEFDSLGGAGRTGLDHLTDEHGDALGASQAGGQFRREIFGACPARDGTKESQTF